MESSGGSDQEQTLPVTGGYDCDFTEAPPEELQCPVCLRVLRDPTLNSCCGQHFCQSCIRGAMEDHRPCPLCKEMSFTLFLDKKVRRKILHQLEVRCPALAQGCEWVGLLGELEGHLDLEQGDCSYAELPCPSPGCGEPVQRRNMEQHLTQLCRQRSFSCTHCGLVDTHQHITGEHWASCQLFPVGCPNRCSLEEQAGHPVRRGALEEHLSQCPLQEVPCSFSYAGCKARLLRRSLPLHMEASVHEHLVALASYAMRVSERLEEVAAQQSNRDQKMAQVLLERDHMIAHVQRRVEEGERLVRRLEENMAEKDKQAAQLLRQMQESKQESTDFHTLASTSTKLTATTCGNTCGAAVERADKAKTSGVGALAADISSQSEPLKGSGVDVSCEEGPGGALGTSGVGDQGSAVQGLSRRLERVEHVVSQHHPGLGFSCFLMTSLTRYTSRHKFCFPSPPFYSHPGGYRMKCEVIPNSASGTGAMAVYVYVLRGEFDEQLKWPLRAKVTLRLVDQTGTLPAHEREMGGVWRRMLSSDWRDNFQKFNSFVPHSLLDKYAHNDGLMFCLRTETN